MVVKVVAMWTNLKSVKPYLFPLSSMSAKQFEEFQSVLETISNSNFLHRFAHNLIDWYNKNHFDYRGLIPLGLAIDCTNLNIY